MSTSTKLDLMKNGILRSLGACTLLLFICFSSVLTAKNIIGHSHIAPTIWGLPISSSPFSENIKGNLNIPLEDVTAPTAALTYTLDGSVVSSVKQDDVVIITATLVKPWQTARGTTLRVWSY